MRNKLRRPLIGAHVSTAGGLHLALERGAALGCATIQIFTKNASQWRERAPSEEEVTLFGEALRRTGLWPVFAHGGYLLNPASGDEALRRRSVRALAAELERCRRLGLPWAVIHPGSHGGDGEEAGLARAARSLREVLAVTAGSAPTLLLENTAGQGSSIGWRLEQLARLLAEVGDPGRLGVCFDTCHAFAAGYDLRTPAAWKKTLEEIERTVGLGRVKVIHVNDAKRELGSRVDRHEHLGRGRIGQAGLGLVVRERLFRDVPKVLETPKHEGEKDMDPVNLAVLRRLAG